MFRGYLFERLGKLFGTSTACQDRDVSDHVGPVWPRFTTSTRGSPGVQQATIVGLVFGTVFAVTGRIWTLMCAHAAFDLTALAIIYWDLESAVAHAIFD